MPCQMGNLDMSSDGHFVQGISCNQWKPVISAVFNCLRLEGVKSVRIYRRMCEISLSVHCTFQEHMYC